MEETVLARDLSVVLKQPQGTSFRSEKVGQKRQSSSKVQDSQGVVLNMDRVSCSNYKS